MFFIPKKKLVLHCYTNILELPEVAPIAKANKFFPEWWKKLPKTYSAPKSISLHSTMKSCSGLIDLYSKGIVIPMWSDVDINIGEIGTKDYYYEFRDQESNMGIHDPAQRGDYLPEKEYQHLKISSPWKFYCEENVDFIFMEPTWNLENLSCIKILPGVVNYKYQHNTDVNIMVTRKQEKFGLEIPFLHPIAHIIPIDNREIELKVHYDIDKTFYYSRISHVKSLHTYKDIKKIRQANEQKRCPFGFGR